VLWSSATVVTSDSEDIASAAGNRLTGVPAPAR